MTAWNPHSPDTLGLETLFTEQGDQLLPAAVTLPSTAAETIDSVSPFLIAASDEPATCLLEVFEAGDEIPSDEVTTTVFRPTDDLQMGGVDSENESWATSSLGTTNLYQRIDEANLDTSDWITYFAGMAAAKKYRFTVDTGGSDWPASRRVVGGRVKLVANREEINGTLRAYYYNGSVAYYLGSVTVTERRKTLSIPWPEFNPATNLPWTRAEIQALDVGGGSAIQLRPRNVNKQKQLFIYQAWLELDWVAEERVAVGVREISSADTGDLGARIAFTVQVPNSGADNWAKANSKDYTYLLRRIDGFGRISWRFLAETAVVAEAAGRDAAGESLPVSSYVPVLDTRGFVSSLGGVVAGRALVLHQTTSGAAFSADGQPYGAVDFFTSDEDTTLGQSLSPGNGDYGLVRFLWAYDENAAPTADMEVKVRRLSDNVQFGSTATLTVADMLALPTVGDAVDGTTLGATALPIRVVDAQLATPATLASGTRYYVEFPTSEDGNTPHLILGGDTVIRDDPGGFSNGATAASFGGTTDAQLDDGVASNSNDLSLTLSTQPSAPTGFTAEIVTVTVNDNVGCTVPTVEAVALAWTATSLDADFGCYEIQRKTPTGEWAAVFTGDDEAVDEAVDYDPTLGVAESYRMRVVRAGDHIPSPWTATVTVTAQAAGAEVIFSSNWSRSALAYNRGPDYQWDFPNHDTVVELSGRDFATVFQEAEDRGDRFTVPVLLLVADPGLRPTDDGRAVAEPLRAWLRSGVPHITVRDPYGGRWYGHGTLTDATQSEDQATGVFEGTVEFAQTQADPTPAPM